MDNPEEVLQALDEFQKMRPSEIPRELEDYLCWVAKTGDPVYQWSLIKALFREKLLRVMTDFYESCPSLDLTPCPNVEPFNYDSMKRNLLERLEGFVNAPFTVQRICELLTSPRKEYSRVDKFMRAIEKNILVVSTKEPGASERRSENGDNLVNGSVEDEITHHQQANDIEMDNWVKDCAAASTLAAQTGGDDDEEMPDENGLKASLNKTFDKIDKVEGQDEASTSFDSSVTEFSATTCIPSQLPAEETLKVQNLDATTSETAAIVREVSDSLMNEDTSSQPSTEAESDDSNSSDSRQLQTAFDSKDFKLDEAEIPSEYELNLEEGKSEVDIGSTESSKDCDPVIQSVLSTEEPSVITHTVPPNSEKVTDDVIHSTENVADEVDQKPNDEAPVIGSSDGDELEKHPSVLPITDHNQSLEKNATNEHIVDESVVSTENNCNPAIECENVAELTSEKAVSEPTESDILVKELSADTLDEIIKPLVEEVLPDTAELDDIKTKNTELTIEETTENNCQDNSTATPNSTPIVEEPQDTEPVTEKSAEPSTEDAIVSKSDDPPAAIDNGSAELPKKTDLSDNNPVSVTACAEMPSNKELPEWMDIDDQNLASSAQPEEPMEHEMTETLNS